MITIVGEAPSRSSDPARPFDGYSGKKLAEYCGFSGYEELAANARLINVLGRWPGRGFAGEKGSRFPIARARRAAKRIAFDAHAHVVFAGKRVARAFDFEFSDYFSWKLRCQGRDRAVVWYATIPHPSGCNRWYNDPSRRDQVARFLRTYVFAQRAGELLLGGMSSC